MAGVSLLELMIVVGLVGVLALLAGPELRRIVGESRERSEVLDVYNHIDEARSSAQSMMIPVTVRFHPHSLIVTSSRTPTRSFPLSPNISSLKTSSHANVLTFNAMGGLDAVGPTMIVLKTARGATYNFVVYPAIGAIRFL